MKRIILAALCVLTIGTVCAQKHHVVQQSQARMITTNMGAVTAPIIAELGEISPEKIVYERRFDISFYQKAEDIINNLSEYKQYTIAKYCAENNYDVVVNAIFQVETDRTTGELVVQLIGYPAKYKRFRPATREDSWMLQYLGEERTNSRQIINGK